MLNKPLWLLLLATRWYRLRSRQHKSKKTVDIMDINPQSGVDSLRKYRALRLIHGHTQRPGIHDLLVDGLAAQRFVLAEWKRHGASVLCWNAKNYRLESITDSME